MKLTMKYFTALIVSVMLFIKGDLSVVGAWLGTVNFIPFQKKTQTEVSRDNSIQGTRNLVVSVSGKTSGKAINELPLHLMNDEYQILAKANIRDGKVSFDLNGIEHLTGTIILISPVTSNEMKINSQAGYVDFVVDDEPGILLQATAYNF